MVKVVKETEDAATVVIKPGWGWSFVYQAGQYVGCARRFEGYRLGAPPTKSRARFHRAS